MIHYYLDVEFDGFGGELISLALVREDGKFLYLADIPDRTCEWVSQNVVPIIDVGEAPEYIPRAEWGQRIADFLTGDKDPLIIADWPDDIRYFCQCLINGPGQRVHPLGILGFCIQWVDAYPTTLAGAVQHNALWDARAIKYKLTGS